MIFGNLNQAQRYAFLPEKVKAFFNYVQEHDLLSYEEGSYKINGDEFFVNVNEYDTVLREDRFWEAHKKYIDVHVMLKGQEFIDVNFIDNMQLGEYKADNDFQALDGEEPQFSAYGKQAPKIFKTLVASLFVVAIVFVGFCLLIIPGIYLCARLQFYAAAIVEEDAGIMESLNRSWNLTKGNVMRLILLFLSYIGIITVGLLLLIIGVFVAEPVICLMYCDTYRQLCKNLPAEAKETIPQEETAI